MRARYESFFRRSLDEREAFWREQAELIHWEKPFDQVCDDSKLPFANWFVGGTTNLCYNSVDRHLAERADQPAIIWVSTEQEREEKITYRQLHEQVNALAAVLQEQGVVKGDRVLIYMPMIPEALVAMLACVRLGIIHSVVFGGFASHALASRIDDAKPKMVITADAGLRGGKAVNYKPLLKKGMNEAMADAPMVLTVNRGVATEAVEIPGELDYATEMAKHAGAVVDPVWVESSHPSYILYTSGTTGKPKGVQRDTGGHAVAMRASLKHIYGVEPGETMFSGSDIGWVVGHSYIVYAPLLTGATTIVYEGLPIRPDPGIWWRIVQDHKVNCLFTSPTAIRLLKKSGEEWIHKYDLSSMRSLFLAGEPLDKETHRWVMDALKCPVVDNYWQTETGWPILTNFMGLGLMELKHGSPSLPAYGYDVILVDEQTAQPVGPNQKGSLMIRPPLPPGCMTTVYGDDERFVSTYFSRFKEPLYATFDYAMYDEDGYYFIMGRDDDVINVAGHRMGTREVEEALCLHPAVAEAAAVGIKDEIKGQEIEAFVVLMANVEPPTTDELRQSVARELGPIAKPKYLHIVTSLPKTRSGKVIRRAIQSLAEGGDPGDLPTIEDATVLDQIRGAVKDRS
ncbi:propionate--CoA ligase [Magnetofaba australis]|uniref:Propionate--CoA ligase n=1 Tax=Magnetofaba australis IT-1 TaxID=1434232 RepID=A0A1Y2K907_9PROT|nr:propionate--CoA ligase [Magnetofaba australis]OSM07231.1 putative propionyl-CoA synthetase [Magnetofaba australis IT-1]